MSKSDANKVQAKVEADYKLVEDGMGLTIETLFQGLKGLVQSKTVVGEPIRVDDVTIVPLVDVSAGLASGALGKSAKQNGAGAMSAKISPVALLVLQGGKMRLINVKNQDIFTRLADLIPDAVDKLTGARRPDEAAEQTAREMAEQMEPMRADESMFEDAEANETVISYTVSPDGSVTPEAGA